jgi:vitamin B12 transporter
MRNRYLLIITLLLCTINLLSAKKNVVELQIFAKAKTKQNISNITSSVKIITSKEIKEKRYTTLIEALSSLSDISFSTNGGIGQSSSIHLRGFDSKHTLVLIDGSRMNDPTGLSGANFSAIMMNDVERIEVIYSGASIWGADASGGVINIITKKAKQGLNASSDISYGSFDTKEASFNISYKNEDFYIKTNISHLKTNGFSAKATRGKNVKDFENDGYENNNFGIKLGYYLNKDNKIEFTNRRNYSNLQSDPFNDPDGQENSKSTTILSRLDFSHQNSFNDVKLSLSDMQVKREYPTNIFKGGIREYNLDSKIPYSNNSFVLLGAGYKNFAHDDYNKSTINKSIYLSNTNELSLIDAISSIAFRYDKYDNFDDAKTGSLGIKKKVSKNIFLSANYNISHSIPTIYQLYAPATLYGNLGNKDLKPEKTKGYELSFGAYNFVATYFHNKITNLIGFENGYVNLSGDTTIKGYTLSYENKIARYISYDISATKLYTKDAQGDELARRAKTKGKANIYFDPTSSFRLNLNGVYIGTRYDNKNKKSQTGRYFLFGLTGNYEYNDNFTIYGKVSNLLNKYYQEVEGYATSSRAFYVGLNAKI